MDKTKNCGQVKRKRKRKPAKVHYSLRLSPEMSEALERLMAKHDVSFSQLTEHLILRGLITTRWMPLCLVGKLDLSGWGGAVEDHALDLMTGHLSIEEMLAIGDDLNIRANQISLRLRDGLDIPSDPIDLLPDYF
jgi:hypothetical protein